MMDRNRISLPPLLFMVILSSLSAMARPVPSLNLPVLTREADYIVVGQVIALREEGRVNINEQGQSIPARQMIATLRVDRVLKGQATLTTISIRFFLPEAPLGYKGIAAAQFGMFFLRETSQQGYAVLNPYHPFIVAAPDTPFRDGNILDQVIAEVIQVLVTSRVSPNERKQAIDILSGIETAATTAALQQAARNLDISLRLQAAAALLRRSDITVLNMVGDALLHPPQNIERNLLSSLAFAIQDGVKDPQAIPMLTKLLKASDVQTRRGAAAALRHTRVDVAIEPLSIALQDSDREVRYHAVLGLATITGQTEWGPTFNLFEQDEQRYLTYWRGRMRRR